ncbi:PREDICTED: nuclear pore complex protein NUP107 isoform X2 [Nelumbo nucifera]|uniref:Nuclear pore complex protein n=1 Tax=Nelumbo nucifera TaxID=4432 RepID=A0A1U8AI22_NELNU|nr:PREDICTED: nuclear pore complex protein NUP107 isoform X2 [Nelumbo nucifera]
MDVDMDTSPSYFDPEDLSTREQFRRYGKRRSPSSISPPQEGLISRFSVAGILFDEHSIQRRPNAALFLEEIKQEVENFEDDGLEGIPTKTPYSSKRRLSVEGHGLSEANDALDSFRQVPSLLKSCKHEDEVLADCGETTFALFASLLDSALQGLMPIPDLILRFENACRSVSESIRYGSNGRQRAVEDKLMRQKARLLLDEAASWSLLWHLFGKGNEELPEDLILSPSTSHLEACQFVMTDHTAQLCLRIVQWLEGLASEALELENRVRGCHVGSYLPNSGVWHHTQRILKKGSADSTIVQHLDFDAPTREIAHQLLDDKKQDESLLEDIWTLLRAGRLEEACELCRSAGQPWRAATICPFGGFDNFPSIEAVVKSGKNRTLQAIELESGIGHQWRLWKWASYCASEKIAEQDGGKYETAVFASQCSNLKRMLPLCTDWESACWAMAKSWLDVQVDLELARFQPGGHEQLKSNGGAIETSPGHGDQTFHTPGPESWPCHVLSQQPRDLSSLLQKLHSGDMVHEAVSRGCKEQHRQIEMNLMVGDIPHLLELLWSWISPSEDDQNVFRPHGDPQMIRFGAHLVLVLRYLLADQMKDTFREKLMTVGDLILHMYAMFLFSKQHEELVGIYASQLASHRCIDLFVHMMELRINASNVLFREFALISMWRVPKLPIGAHMLLSFLVEPLKQPTKVLLSLEDHDIPENLKEFQDWSKYYSCDATYRNWLKIELENAAVSLDEISPEEGQRAIAAAKEMLRASLLLLSRKESPWLVVNEDHFYESEDPVFLELHATALLCLPSGECMYPDATSCTTLTSALYSSVSEEVVLKRQLMVNVSISTRNSCCIEVVLRCLAVEGDGLGPQDNSDGGILATVLAAGFKGELVRFQAGVTLDISRLDAWYSSKDGSLENPATYIVRGLCRRCCLPEIVLRCMQVSVSLVESGETPEDHDELIELVAHPEFGLLQLFSQHQLQEFLLFEREYSICKMELQEEPFAGHS